MLPGVVVCALLAACGLDVVGQATDPDASARAGDPSSSPSAPSASPDGGRPEATASCEPAGSCGVAVASGFEVVAFATSRDACPAGLASVDVVAQPAAGAGACTCGACASATPDCGDVTLQTYYDNGVNATCGSTGFAITGKNGACSPKSNGFSGHSSVGVATTDKGTCTANASPNRAAVDATQARICLPKAGCGWPGCVSPPAPFAVCLAHDGDVPCPSGAPKKTLVGDDFTLSCGACACSVVSATCPGNLTFYDDAACSQNPRVLAADGVCVSRSGTFDYYKWSPATPTNVVCTTSAPPAGTVGLAGMRTVCCL